MRKFLSLSIDVLSNLVGPAIILKKMMERSVTCISMKLKTSSQQSETTKKPLYQDEGSNKEPPLLVSIQYIVQQLFPSPDMWLSASAILCFTGATVDSRKCALQSLEDS